MRYRDCVEAVFLSRVNRFVARVCLGTEEITVHVKNTGRCRELLVPGARVYLTSGNHPLRKTAFDLIAVEKKTDSGKTILINMDSVAPNDLVSEWLPQSGFFSEMARFRREVAFGNSRFDFLAEDGERRVLIEVKGVTLEHEGRTLFPDAPTLRGRKHLLELTEALKAGYEACVIFVIQMEEAIRFSPNEKTDPEFARALRYAHDCGIALCAYCCKTSPQEIAISREVPIVL